MEKVKESRKFGLKIGQDLIEKEEVFFLLALNRYGGIEYVVKNHDFDEVSKEMGEAAGKIFEKEGREYFDKFKQLQGAGKFSGSLNSYMVHLEVTRGAILNLAYSGQIEA